jgi:hypothetical protein
MGRDDPHSEDIAWFDLDSEPAEPAPPRLPWPRWFKLAVAVAVVAAGVVAVNHERSAPSAAQGPAAPASASASRSTPATSARAAVLPSPAVSVTRVGHPLLGATTGWELFGRGEGYLVRIQPAAGRITRTTIPQLDSSGPVSIAAGSDQVLIRPLDNVPGYLVPDDKPARELSSPLDQAGPVFPGPAPNQVWIWPGDQPAMALASLDGARLPESIPIPQGGSGFDAIPDGAGYLLFSGIGGVYDSRPEGLRRITTGAVMAVGPTGWLVVECDEQYRCHTVLVGRLDRSRRAVDAGLISRERHGVISPDGSTVAIWTSGPDGNIGLYLLDLRSGNQRVLPVSGSQLSYDGGVVFAPDSTRLFVVEEDGTLAVVDCRTGTIGTLGVSLPALAQLVLRPTR